MRFTDGMPVSCVMAKSRRANPQAMTFEDLEPQYERASQDSGPNPAGGRIKAYTVAGPSRRQMQGVSHPGWLKPFPRISHASDLEVQCLWPHMPEPQPPPWKDGLAQGGSAYWLALLLPCTAGADTSFRTSMLPHSGQAGADSLILCITV